MTSFQPRLFGYFIVMIYNTTQDVNNYDSKLPEKWQTVFALIDRALNFFIVKPYIALLTRKAIAHAPNGLYKCRLSYVRLNF